MAAAESWAQATDNLEADLEAELEERRRAEKDAEDDAYQTRYQEHRRQWRHLHAVGEPYADRCARELGEAQPRAGDRPGRGGAA